MQADTVLHPLQALQRRLRSTRAILMLTIRWLWLSLHTSLINMLMVYAAHGKIYLLLLLNSSFIVHLYNNITNLNSKECKNIDVEDVISVMKMYFLLC